MTLGSLSSTATTTLCLQSFLKSRGSLSNHSSYIDSGTNRPLFKQCNLTFTWPFSSFPARSFEYKAWHPCYYGQQDTIKLKYIPRHSWRQDRNQHRGLKILKRYAQNYPEIPVLVPVRSLRTPASQHGRCESNNQLLFLKHHSLRRLTPHVKVVRRRNKHSSSQPWKSNVELIRNKTHPWLVPYIPALIGLVWPVTYYVLANISKFHIGV